MTVTEFSNEFDILYDNLASKGSPALDNYEKSVFLSKAQLEVVKNKENPKGNKYGKGFEGNEKRRVDLKELLKDYKTSNPISSTSHIEDSSKFFKIPSNVFLIRYESVKLSADNECVNGKTVKVVPKTYDEYDRQKDNPFKNPDKNLAWRLDLSKQQGENVVEIISKYDIAEYRMRYLMIPTPIILSDLDTEFPEEGLTIQGENKQTNCILNKSVHQEILDRAVELATVYYKTNDINTRVQLNTRNE